MSTPKSVSSPRLNSSSATPRGLESYDGQINDTKGKSDSRLAAIYKGHSEIHAESKKLNLVNKYPDKKVDKPCVVITGPYNKIMPSFGHAYGTTISTYPKLKAKQLREGDPICDSYRVHCHPNGTILCVADGCGWGERPKEAGNRIKDNFVTYLTRHSAKIKTTHELTEHFFTALAIANYSTYYDKDDCWMAGTSTFIGGMCAELTEPEGKNNWIFHCCSVGDCKAYYYDCETSICSDITDGNRMNLTDPRDPGGRLGPYTRQGGPDLRNFDIFSKVCKTGDILLLCSDGVHDNFDPQHLGKLPRELGIDADTWDDVSEDIGTTVKTKFMTQLLTKMLTEDGQAPVPSYIAKKVIRHCRNITGASREWMEQNPHGKLAHDYQKFPGKLDHTTIVAVTVGPFVEGENAVPVRSVNPQVWPFG